MVNTLDDYTLDDYFEAKEVADISANRLQRLARQAFDAGLDAIGDDVSKLTQEAVRGDFMLGYRRVYDSVLGDTSNIFSGENDILKRSLLGQAFYGFSANDMANFVDKHEDKCNFVDYMNKFLFNREKPGFLQAMEKRSDHARGILGEVPVDAILDHVDVANVPYKDKVGTPEKMELLEQYKIEGIISPAFLKEKHYMAPNHSD